MYFKSMLETVYSNNENQGSKGDVHKSAGFIMGPPVKQMIKNSKIGGLQSSFKVFLSIVYFLIILP